MDRILLVSGREWSTKKGAFFVTDEGTKVAMFSNAPGYELVELNQEIFVTWGRDWQGYPVISAVSLENKVIEMPDKGIEMFRYSVIAPVEKSMVAWNIKVKGWMTSVPDECEESDFTLHKDLNGGIPMPMRQMRGVVIAETKGMYYMMVRGYTAPVSTCLHCGRKLTHPVSLLFGIGPICGEHFHQRPAGVDMEKFYQELQDALPQVTWSGWIPKSGIVSMTLATA